MPQFESDRFFAFTGTQEACFDCIWRTLIPATVRVTREMSRSEFTSFLQATLTNLRKYSLDGSIHFICMDWRHMTEILAAGEAIYDELKNLVRGPMIEREKDWWLVADVV
jgi:hypothetical protein